MLFGLFKKKTNPNEVEEPVSVGSTGISYKPQLIENLKADHVNLLDIYNDIKLASEDKNFQEVEDYLIIFRNELEDHLLKENINLYIYLSHLLKDDSSNSGVIASFRKEMDAIASIVLKFLAKYESIETDVGLQEGFAKEFGVIGEVLGTRIQREESTLYTFYTKPV